MQIAKILVKNGGIADRLRVKTVLPERELVAIPASPLGCPLEPFKDRVATILNQSFVHAAGGKAFEIADDRVKIIRGCGHVQVIGHHDEGED